MADPSLSPTLHCSSSLTTNHPEPLSQPQSHSESPPAATPPSPKPLCPARTSSPPASWKPSTIPASIQPSSDQQPPAARSKSPTANPTRVHKKERPSYSKQRARRIKQTINATLARCQGQTGTADVNDLAYPVHLIKQNLFYVPATYSDYQAFYQYRASTNASHINTAFNRKALIPGRRIPTQCITVKMPTYNHEVMRGVMLDLLLSLKQANWKFDDGSSVVYEDTASTAFPITPGKGPGYNAEADGSLRIKGQDMPFVVLEIGNSQKVIPLDKRVFHWGESTRGCVKIIIAIKIHHGDCVTATVIKTQKRACGNAENPNAWTIDQHHIIDKEVIYPGKSRKSFTISKSDILPEDRYDPADPGQSITIKLKSWAPGAMDALEHEDNAPTPRDPDQVITSSPSGSFKTSPATSQSGESDDPNDMDFQPE
ncbi:MAG: hypothetical protein Q9168_006878 [Polycauliona sp. 1 TL-2023]